MAGRLYPTFLLLVVWARFSIEGVNTSRGYYVGAVVEYHRFWDHNLESSVNFRLNLKNYTDIVSMVKDKGIDIIVFPEVGLLSGGAEEFVRVPEARMKVTPRLDPSQHEVLQILSRSAFDNGVYLVVNLKEISKSEGEGPDHIYNTNVAFDRQGTVVARYRKFHPFAENVTKPDTPDHSYFDTDFGVRFGMFTCFDILFEEPAQVLVREYGVTDVAYPTAWFSQLPFLTAVQYQASWSYGTGANMLASGLNHVEGGSTGTGIYAGGDGPLEYILSEKNGCKLIYQRIPIRGKSKEVRLREVRQRRPVDFERSGTEEWDENNVCKVGDATGNGQARGCSLETGAGKLSMLRENLDLYTTALLDPAYDSVIEVEVDLKKRTKTRTYLVDTELCQGNRFCCSYRLLFEMRFVAHGHPVREDVSGDDYRPFRYRLAVLDGVRDFEGQATGGIQVCGLISCLDTSVDSCGLRADSGRPVSRKTVEDPDLGPMVLERTVFREISINGTFAGGGSSFVSPNVLLGSESGGRLYGRVPSAGEFRFARVAHSGVTSARLDLDNAGKVSVVAAAIYARLYRRDGQPAGVLGGREDYSVLYLVLCLMALCVLDRQEYRRRQRRRRRFVRR